MIDTWAAERAFENFVNAIHDDHWTEELQRLANIVENQIADVGYDHDCSYDCSYAHDSGKEVVAGALVSNYLSRLKMGYEVPSTLEILEELRKELGA